jgi:hypothetical protein
MEEVKSETGRRAVFRPGLGQYAYLLAVPALWAALPIAFMFSQPLTVWTLLAISQCAIGVIGLAYMLGMRIELDDERVSKVYFFGLFRNSIRLSQLRARIKNSYRGGTEANFESADGEGFGFTIQRTFAWRRRDFDRLCAIAAASERRREGRLATARELALENHTLDIESDVGVESESLAVDLVWIVITGAVAAFALLIGIGNATHFHSWTGVLDVAAGLLSFGPLAGYIAYRRWLPQGRFAVVSARAVILVLTIAIPLGVWIALHGPPCPPNCGPGT